MQAIVFPVCPSCVFYFCADMGIKLGLQPSFLPVVTCQSLAPESCIHYSYPQQADCLSFTNCSGAQCNITSPSGHASFVVHKCQDPVAVDLTVVTQNSNFQRMFDHSEHLANVSAYWSDASVTMSRNATHLHFQVSYVTTLLRPNCRPSKSRSLIRRVTPSLRG